MVRSRIVIAPDSFKGSASASDVGRWLAEGWRDFRPEDDVRVFPMADGGEGTLESLASAVEGAKRHPIVVDGPTGSPVSASWLELPSSNPGGRPIAVVELAATSGLTLAAPAPLDAGTRGFGQVVRAALEFGVSAVAMGLGGSASTDGGAGFLSALGARIRDDFERAIKPGARGLLSVRSVDLTSVLPIPTNGAFILADVRNPLLGANGAASVFGPQKGADAAEVRTMETALQRFAALMTADPDVPGAGAAGGTGFALLAWGGRMTSGADYVAKRIGLEDAVEVADLVITGEGKYDSQTAQGKVVEHVSNLTRSAGKPVMLAAGAIDAPVDRFAGAISLIAVAGSAEEAISRPAVYLREAGRRLAAAWCDPRDRVLGNVKP